MAQSIHTNPLQQVLETRFLPFVEKPMRYIGNELNIIRKDLEQCTVHGVLCFPEAYEIGMSHYGTQILYHIVNKNPAWALSRAFMPWSDAEELMRQNHIPLYSLEYFLPVKDADWVGFSVQYELQYTNIVTMLDLAGIPLWQRDRTDGVPIIIGGGPCMGNPEPIADFFDAFVIGDGEDVIIQICQIIEHAKTEKLSRSETLLALGRLNGIYVPSLSGQKLPVRAAKVPILKPENYPDKPLVPLLNVVHHRLAIEIMRGCTHGCRFCAAGYYYRPVRERLATELAQQMDVSLSATGWREIGLLSLSTADYSDFTTLLHECKAVSKSNKCSIGIPSTRIDSLTADQFDLLQSITPNSSFTIAPEAGSERLRRVINKDFSEEQILQTTALLLDRNIQTLKLYFMIGLPTETADDIDAIVGLIQAIGEVARKRSGRITINVSLSPFSPKAHTPFQWEAMDTVDSLLAKSKHIKEALRRNRNVDVSYRDPYCTLLETVMARGDRSVAKLIHGAFLLGARNDGWHEKFDFSRWQEASVSTGIDFDKFTNAQPVDGALPWENVSTGVSSTYLRHEREHALGMAATADCRSGVCTHCGVCVGSGTTVIVDKTEYRNSSLSDKSPAKVSTIPVVNMAYRLIFNKGALSRFLGHRDTMNVLERALLAAGVKVAYSQGYHPHTRVSFGPPLPLGVIGEHEPFDCVTVWPMSCAPAYINTFLPLDLTIRSITQITNRESALNVQIESAAYRFLPLVVMDNVLLQQQIDALLAQRVVVVESEKEGVAVKKDIRPLVMKVALVNNEIHAVLALAPGKTCKPVDFLHALVPGVQAADFVTVRAQCLRNDGSAIV